MSYAGKDPRSRRTAASATAGSSASMRDRRGDAADRVLERELSISARGLARPPRARSSPHQHELDWQHIAIFAAGAVVGATIGAGAALLFAPQSGERTRHNLARQGRHLRTRSADAWDDLRHELRYATRRGRRKLARKVKRALGSRHERHDPQDEPLLDD